MPPKAGWSPLTRLSSVELNVLAARNYARAGWNVHHKISNWSCFLGSQSHVLQLQQQK